MNTIYYIQDTQGRTMTASNEDGELRVTMIFYPEDGLTMEEVCVSMGWTILEKKEFEEPQLVPFKPKD